MHDLWIANCVVGLLCATTLTSCSLLIGTSERQCKSNADCVASKLGSLCVDQVCTEMTSCQGATCTTSEMILPSDNKCTSDKQCTNPELPRCFSKKCVPSGLAEQWICPADEPAAKPPTVRYGFHIIDFVTGMVPKNIVVKACRVNDVACAEPAGMFIDTDSTGHAVFDLPYNFLGYFEINSVLMPALLYVTKPIVRNTMNRDVPVLDEGTVMFTATLAKVVYDPTKGLALLEAIDCSGNPAGGVQFKLTGAMSTQFYLVDQLPNLEATETIYDVNNNTADGGYINIDSGFVTFTAVLSTDTLELGSFNAQIRAGTITYIDMDF